MLSRLIPASMGAWTQIAEAVEPRSDYAQDLHALRNLIEQIDLMLHVPNGKGLAACREATKAALALVTHLAATTVAAQLGAKGGNVTAKRGSEYYRQIASQRKTHAGGPDLGSLFLAVMP